MKLLHHIQNSNNLPVSVSLSWAMNDEEIAKK